MKDHACHLQGTPRPCAMNFHNGQQGGCLHGFTISGKARKSARTCVHFYAKSPEKTC